MKFFNKVLQIGLLLFLMLKFEEIKGQSTIYLHNFGTTTITTHPYMVAPSTFGTNLSASSWSNSTNAWTSFSGSAGQAIALNNSGGTPTITLTFNIASGYKVTINQFNFWRQRSNSGAQNWSMTINNVAVGSGAVPTTGDFIGLTTVASPVENQTGTITVILSLSGASSTGTFRLDDFQLTGTVEAVAACTPPNTQATYSAATNVQSTQMQTNWTRGNGTHVLVVARAGSAVNATPSNGTSYTPNATYGSSGSQLGTGNYVVYNGTGTNVTVTGLSLSTTYHYAIFEYNSTGTCYMTPGATGNQATLGLTNDDCSGATSLTPSSTTTCAGATAGTTVGATSSGVPAIQCLSNTGNADDDVWYSFVATSTSHTITVVGAGSLDAVIDLRSGGCNGTNIGCADANGGGGTEVLTATSLTINQTYLVRVYGYSGSAGTGTFTICVTTPPLQNYYRSKQSGAWTSASNWEISTDNSTWSNASVSPTSSDLGITIRSGHNVTISTTLSIDQVVIESGATLSVTGSGLTLADGAGFDLDCSGTFVNGGNPDWDGTMNVQGGGTYVHNTTSSAGDARDAASLSPNSTWVYRGSSSLTPAAVFSGRTYEHLSFETTSGSLTINMVGSSALTVNGNFIVGSGVTLTNGMTGTNVFAGDFTNNGTINNSTGIQIYSFTGAGATISGAVNFEALTIGATAHVTLGSGISIASGFSCTVNGTLDCGNYVVSGAGGFTLASGATLITSNANGVSGAVTVVGTKTFSSGANYEFQGASTGTFTTTPTANTVNNLTINSSDIVALAQTLTVAGILNLSIGQLNLGGSNLTANSINGPSFGGAANNYIIARGEGTLRRSAGTNVLFPIGTSDEYMPCRLNGGTGTFYANLAPTNMSGLPTGVLDYQWNLTNGSGPLDMAFQWPTAVEGDGFPTSGDIHLYKNNGTWSSVGTTTAPFGNPKTAQFSSLSCCSGFTVGSGSLLPVELVQFKAVIKDQQTKLYWQTASELNNAYFAIEKSTDGNRFQEIDIVPGNGTNYEVNDYTFTDAVPAAGINYYRLKQVDNDGRFEYSKVVSVYFGSGKEQVQLYPTLAADEINLRFQSPAETQGMVQVFDQAGRLVQYLYFDAEITDLPIATATLSSGNYFVRVQNGKLLETLRFVKQ